MSSHRDKAFLDEHCRAVNERNFSIQRIHNHPALLINALIMFPESLFTLGSKRGYEQQMYLERLRCILQEMQIGRMRDRWVSAPRITVCFICVNVCVPCVVFVKEDLEW